MLPIYQNMDPHYLSRPSNHVSHGQHYYPVFEAVPRQTRVDHAVSPMNFGPWLHPGSYPYPFPTGCHGCCSHSPHGYCSYWQPHSYTPSPPSMVVPRPCQPFYNHPGYAIAPLHYPPEISHYEYDKSAGKENCCGCPNHSCKGKANSNVKIEEQMPESTQKRNDPSNGPHMQHYPCPVVWLPQSYDKDEVNNKSSDTMSNVSNGWYPLDLKDVVHPNPYREEKRMKEDPQLPFPVLMVPGYNNPEDQKQARPTFKAAEGQEPKLKIIPLRFIEDDKRGDSLDAPEKGPLDGVSIEFPAKEKSPVGGAATDTNDSHGKPRDKVIPTKQVEGGRMNPSEFHDEAKKAGNPTKQEDASTEKSTESNKQSTSSVKTSKLPPVCLRVDPLPKKRNGKGTSSAPSPPGGTQDDHAGRKPSEDRLKEANPRKKKIKVIEVKEKEPSSLNNTEAKPSGEISSLEANMLEDSGPEEKEVMDVKVPDCAHNDMKENEVNVSYKQKTTEDVMGLKRDTKDELVKKPELSCESAAVRIQSAYRGFEVRRWEPLKKLKQIAKVRGQVKEVNDEMCKLETNAELQLNDKQMAVINENIMSLLLQLDMVQGLHPSVREVRKSVAKELICLQEKLDAIVCDASKKITTAMSATMNGGTRNNGENDMVRSLQQAERKTESQEEGSVLGQTNITSDSQPAGSLVLEERKFKELPVDEHEVEECKSGESSENRMQDSIVEEIVTEHCISALPSESTNEHLFAVGEDSTLKRPVDSGLEEASFQEQGDSCGVRFEGPLEVAKAAGDITSLLEEVPQSETAEPSEAVVIKNVTDNGLRSEHENSEVMEENITGDKATEPILACKEESTMEGMQCLSDRPEVAELACVSSVLEADGAESPVSIGVAQQSNTETSQESSEKKFVTGPSSLEVQEPHADKLSHTGVVSVNPSTKGDEFTSQLLDETRLIQPSLPVNFSGPIVAEASTSSELAAMTNTESNVPAMGPTSDEALHALSPIEEGIVDEEASAANVECLPVTVSKEASCSLATPAEPVVDHYLGSPALVEDEAMIISKDAKRADDESALSATQAAADGCQLAGSIEVTGPQEYRGGSHIMKDSNLMMENEKLRKMLENLIAAGREQLSAMNDLSGRVKDLERQLTRRKKLKVRKQKRRQSSCGALMNNVQAKSLHPLSAA